MFQKRSFCQRPFHPSDVLHLLQGLGRIVAPVFETTPIAVQVRVWRKQSESDGGTYAEVFVPVK
jgi:hypothetical protein